MGKNERLGRVRRLEISHLEESEYELTRERQLSISHCVIKHQVIDI